MAKKTLHLATLLLLVCGLTSCVEVLQALAETSQIATSTMLQTMGQEQQGAANANQAASGYSDAQYAGVLSSTMNVYNTNIDPNKNPYAISLPSAPTVVQGASSGNYNSGQYSAPATNSSNSSNSSSNSGYGPANYERHNKRCDRCRGSGKCHQCNGTTYYKPTIGGSEVKCSCGNGICRVCNGSGETFAGYW